MAERFLNFNEALLGAGKDPSPRGMHHKEEEEEGDASQRNDKKNWALSCEP